ncbi:uncharacterized protein LOC116603397 [Nematostella vectensis]|uniref:uncharacterized protein LOC116603397 n=1 Tax=Nematostella vectensis TaxID=45351 RepID=UPI002076F40D|nr:uncharacterized protein LOC116603397 [Nematostella vectensis]
MSSVRALHIEQGFPDPLASRLRLQRVLRGIKRTLGTPPSSRLPVTTEVMSMIHKHLDLTLFDHAMFWAACCLAYSGFLRASEFMVNSSSIFSPDLHLNVPDISVDSMSNPTMLRIHVKASKTDPFRKGTHVFICRAKPPVRAVEAVLGYLTRRGGPPGPLFVMESGQPLSRQKLTSWLREILQLEGVPGNYSSHSFRIGAATVAVRNGLPDHLIQTLGRWTSGAYRSYIRTPVDVLAGASSKLV